jgi:4,4-dimethyl-9beta,19-cyclopropylsterol-4alpha-methyl oxidase
MLSALFFQGYRFHKAYLAKLKDLGQNDGEKGDGNGLSYAKLD